MNEPTNYGTSLSTNHYCRNTGDLVCPLTGADSALDNPPFKTNAVYLFGNVSVGINFLLKLLILELFR